MRGAFVLRLGPHTDPSTGHLEGSIEEIDSGKEVKFQSSAELLRFLHERFQATVKNKVEADRPTTFQTQARAKAQAKRIKTSNADSRRENQ